MSNHNYIPYNMSESAMDIIASRINRHLWIRTYINGNSADNGRATTDQEALDMRRIAKAALLGMNYHSWDKKSVQSALDTAEFTVMQFIPGINGYLSLYGELKDINDAWTGCCARKPVQHWLLTGIRNMFPEEIDYIDERLSYASDEDLVPFQTTDDAQIQIDGILSEGSDQPLPEALKDPCIMLMLWNTYVLCR